MKELLGQLIAKDHPFWKLAITLSQLGVLTIILVMTSSNFDETETMTVGGMTAWTLFREYIVADRTPSSHP